MAPSQDHESHHLLAGWRIPQSAVDDGTVTAEQMRAHGFQPDYARGSWTNVDRAYPTNRMILTAIEQLPARLEARLIPRFHNLLQTIYRLTAKVTHMSASVSEELATIKAALTDIQADSTDTAADLVLIKDKIDVLLGGTTLSPADRAALDEVAALAASAVASAESVKQTADGMAGPVVVPDPVPEPEPVPVPEPTPEPEPAPVPPAA